MLNPDFRDMLSIFNEENVEYLLIGAYALAAYGNPRATKDMDLWVLCSAENSDRIVRALQRFGTPSGDVLNQDFIRPGITLQIGVPPRRIDVVTEIDGVSFAEAYRNRLMIEVDGVKVPVIGRQDLLTNKKAAGRPQDVADASWLETDKPES